MVLLSTSEVARELSVSDSDVRRLRAAGRLHAQKIGASLAYDAAEVHRLKRQERTAGRPWSPATAWAAMELLSGVKTTLVDQPRRSRLRASLRAMDADRFHQLARKRAEIVRYHASEKALAKLAGLLDPSGVSLLTDSGVARRFGMSAAPADRRAEGYYSGPPSTLETTLRLRRDASGTATVRYLADSQLAERVLGGDALIAVDLLDSDDIRERGAGRTVLQELLSNVWGEGAAH